MVEHVINTDVMYPTTVFGSLSLRSITNLASTGSGTPGQYRPAPTLRPQEPATDKHFLRTGWLLGYVRIVYIYYGSR